MLEALSMLSDEVMELLFEEADVPIELIHKTIREGTIAQQLCPVMVGSAYRNKGIQPLLDAVTPRICPARSTVKSSPRTTATVGPSCRWRRIPMRRWWRWRSSSSRRRSVK